MGFFDRFYYGKAGKRDYSEADMPSNRVSLFFLVLKDHLFDLVKVNLLQAVFWIPAFFWSFLSFAAMEEASARAAESGDARLWLTSVSGHVLLWLAGLIPCVGITGPSTAGAAYVMRNWSRDEHAFLWSDFRDALKDNWKQALPVSFFSASVPVVIFSACLFYGQMAKENAALYVPLALVVSAGLLFALMLVLIYPLMVGYRLRLWDVIRNAFLMAAAQLPRMALARLITLIPVAVWIWGLFAGNQIPMLIVFLYYLLFGLAFSRLLYASFANAVFDLYLNPKIEGAAVRAGMRAPKDTDGDLTDEDEDDPDEDDE